MNRLFTGAVTTLSIGMLCTFAGTGTSFAADTPREPASVPGIHNLAAYSPADRQQLIDLARRRDPERASWGGSVIPPSSPDSPTRLAKARARLSRAESKQTSLGPIGGGVKAAAGVAITHQTQKTTYFCGPAAVSMALSKYGVWVDQTTLANQYLGTTTAGTGWGTGKTGPVVRTMDAFTKSRGLSWSATGVGVDNGATQEDFRAAVATNLTDGNPVIGDAWTGSNSAYFLNGHPNDREISHWYTMYSYSNYGRSVSYLDSIHGNTAISFNRDNHVPARSTLSHYQLNRINRGRGYIW